MMESDTVEPSSVHCSAQSISFVGCECAAEQSSITIPTELRIVFFVPCSDATNARHLHQ